MAAPPRPHVKGDGASAQGGAANYTASDEQIARIARAMGHPNRLAALRVLHQEGRLGACQLYTRMDCAQSTASMHLSVLVAAGLVREGRCVARVGVGDPHRWYEIAPAAMSVLVNELGRFLPPGGAHV